MPARDPGNLGDRLGYASIADYEESHPDMDGDAIGRALTRGATKAQLLAYAVGHVGRIVDGLRRHRAREAEDRAARERAPEPEPAEPGTQRRQAEPDEETGRWWQERNASEHAKRIARYERILADPAGKWKSIDAQGFREWAGDRFAAWYEQARAVAVGEWGWGTRDFEAFWHPRGRIAYWCERSRQQLDQAIAEWADQIRLETTRELLGTLFALGDGATVTWGAATVDQHEQRIEMLAKNAAGVVETAARHEAAIRMIKDAGVICLADLAGPDDDGAAPVPSVIP
jgi:hypothetical protein